MKILKTILALSLVLSFASVAIGATFDFAKPVALFETTLAGRITTTDTSMTLTSATTKDGSALASSTYGFIIDEGTANEEFVLADCTSTACTNMTRGVSTLTGTTTVTALRKEHRRGASVKITDAPILLQLYSIINGLQNIVNNFIYSSDLQHATTSNSIVHAKWVNDRYVDQFDTETIAGVKTFTSIPVLPASDPTTDNQSARKAYVDLFTPLTYLDTDTTLAGNSDTKIATQKATKTYADGLAIAGSPIATNGTAGISKIATKAQASAGTSGDGTYSYLLPASIATSSSDVATTSVVVTNTSGKIDPSFLTSTAYSFASTSLTSTTSVNNAQFVDTNGIRISKFGGTGVDGALALTSGTTTINLGGEAIVTKNYTSISITGTGALAFTNSHANGTIVILKSQGDVTITCSNAPCISVVSNGGAGGAGRSGTTGNGSSGIAGIALSLFNNPSNGGAGTQAGGASDVSGTAGSAIAIATTFSKIFSATNFLTLQKYQHAFTGSGGGGGAVYVATENGIGGTGGNGAGSLIVECGGALNFTKTEGIWAKGTNASSGVNNGAAAYIIAGGGGGAGGFVQILYNKLTANTGTIITTGGSGGGCVNAGDPTVSVGRGGGGGSYGAGNAGGYHYLNCVDSGSNGNGSNGISIVAQNLEY